MRMSLKTLIFFSGIIIPIFIIITFALTKTKKDYATMQLCVSKLGHIGKAMHLYIESEGRGIFYPDRNGAAFLVRLYNTAITDEATLFICPNTTDDNINGQKLFYFNNYDNDDNDNNYISYMGRNNQDQENYPGIFSNKGTTQTAMGGDDTGQPTDGLVENHLDFYVCLFVDGHSEVVSDDDKRYRNLRDPLGN